MRSQTRQGLTLLELALSIALIGMLTAITVPLYQSFQVKNDLDLTTTHVAQTFRRAQLLSQAVDGDTTWGVTVTTDSITLFKGSSYAARETEYDEVIDLPTSLSASGLTEVVFSAMNGFPNATGTLTLTSTTAESRTLILNEKGTVTY